jgi:outer membrane receptor for ferrienterochelin and colicins
MRVVNTAWCIATATVLATGRASAEDQAVAALAPGDLANFTISELLNVLVESPAKRPEFRDDAPASITVISSQEIEAFGANTLLEALERVVGGQIISTFYTFETAIAVRGQAVTHRNSHFLVLIDNRPVRESLNAGQDAPIFLGMPVSRVQQIEIIRGPGSVLHGSGAFLGVINVVTRKGIDQETLAVLRFGTFNSRIAEIAGGASDGDFHVALGGRVLVDDGWYWDTALTDAPPNPDGSFPRLDYLANREALGLNARIDWKGATLNTTFTRSTQRTAALGLLTNDMLPTESPAENPFAEIYLQIYRLQSDLGFEHTFNPQHRGEWHATYNFHLFRQPMHELARDVRERGWSNDGLLEYTHFWTPRPELNVTAGVVGQLVTGKIEAPTLDQNQAPYDVFLNPPNPTPFVSVQPYAELWYSAYAEADYTVAERLKLYAGFQANKSSQAAIDVVPRAGAIVQVLPSLKLRASYGEAFRTASLFDRKFIHPLGIGNDRLAPERIRTVELAALLRRSRLYGTLTGFFNQSEGLVKRLHGPDGTQPNVNSGVIRAWGAELEAKYYFSPSFFALGSFEYARSRDENGSSLGFPYTIAKAGVAYSLERTFGLGVFASHFGASPRLAVRYPGSNPPVAPYLYVDAKAWLDLSGLLSMSVARMKLVGLGTNLVGDVGRLHEFTLRQVDSVPVRPGRALFVGFELSI